MEQNPRIADLRRRVQKDPASIAFAQLAEEYRRAGHHREAVDTCLAGLAIHPGYLSARVTLGRALLELDRPEDAQHEFELVLKSAPENLAAIRGLAEILHRRGALAEALAQYRSALTLARNDPDLEETVNDLERQLTPKKGPEPSDGLSFEQIRQELAVAYVPPVAGPGKPPTAQELAARPPATSPSATSPRVTSPPSLPPAVEQRTGRDLARDRADRTIAVLDQWLSAIHVARAEQHP
jgi:tetratricopeptide (TPR) repeat protein